MDVSYRYENNDVKVEVSNMADLDAKKVNDTNTEKNEVKFDAKLLDANGVKIVNDHSRLYAKKNIDGRDVQFRVDYMNVNGEKLDEKTGKRYDTFNTKQIVDLMNGKPVEISFETTSGVIRNDNVMLARNVNQFGKEAVRPKSVTKITEAEMVHDKSFYDKAKADIQMKAQAESHAKAQKSIAAVLNKVEGMGDSGLGVKSAEKC